MMPCVAETNDGVVPQAVDMTMIIDSPRRREQLAAVAERLPAHVARLA
jgi:hypothetical protein